MGIHIIVVLLALLSSNPVPSQPVFPQDEGRHEEAKMETWTVYALLESPAGVKVGVTVSFFQGRWFIFTGGAVMAGLVHEGKKRAGFSYDVFLPFIGRVEHTTGALNEKFGKHSLVRTGDVLHLTVQTKSLILSLEMRPRKPPVSAAWEQVKGYSIPRMEAHGFVRHMTLAGGIREEVSGHAALTHIWSDSLGEDHDSFVIQLDDGTDVNLVVTHDPHGQGPLNGSHGSVISPEGRLDPITFSLSPGGRGQGEGENGFNFTVTSWWTSPTSKKRYPASWDISLPSHGITLHMTSAADDQELRAMGLSYWMGTCRVRGTSRRKPVTGRAYAVLMGYSKIR